MQDTATPPAPVGLSGAVDALDKRAGLPNEFRYLEATCPRAEWPVLNLHPTARHWLDVHGWFRGQMTDLRGIGNLWREKKIGAGDYRGAVRPRVRQLLGNLHHHHNLESHHAFPLLAAAEPRMLNGFALLDRDHDLIEGLLSAMAEGSADLAQAANESELVRLSDVLADRIERGVALIERHLLDEEEIVVPVLSLRGDQVAF